jgi:hypothetical protein
VELTLEIVASDRSIRAANRCENEVFLVHRAEYQEGDSVAVAAPPGAFLWLALDAAMPPALVYLKAGRYELAVPFGPRRKGYNPSAFTGAMHRLWARTARPEEIAARRDLAFNPFDEHGNSALFPHASANVETRGEAVFAARNAIDGECANDDHGFWPYTSWGINRDPNASLTLDFGRQVLIDEIALTLRADFPHDAWWQRATITFSDHTDLALHLSKTAQSQRFRLPAPRLVENLRLHSLIKAEDPSPFPALTRIEVLGRDPVAS